jgi:asparagine synthase (glutamine-hydrolysing)
MCGLAGFVDFNKQSSADTVRKMADTLIHRGPDDCGYEIYDFENAQVGFGFRRLSILDLSPAGHQPMHFQQAGLTAMLNGELYNFIEVRNELEQLGHTFKSRSDTEVLLHAYAQWGIECIHRFRGMFAIALLDHRNEQLYLIRDRAGVKPLYYFHHGLHFLFASELKAFHPFPHFKKEIHTDALALYFQHGYIPAPFSIFSHTHKLLPGHYLLINLQSKSVLQKQYWGVTDCYSKPAAAITFQEAAQETERIMQQAFQLRLVSDVPVGIFLSGGYDSSLVTALLQKNSSQKLKTFTIGFEEQAYNEAPYARQVARHLGTDHHEYVCTWNEAMEIIPLLPEIYDEPFADSSAIPTYLVSKMARQQVTVALSADGGDETFAGYDKYGKCLRYFRFKKFFPAFLNLPAASLLWLVHQLLPSKNPGRADRLDRLILALRENHPARLFNIITQAMTQLEVKRLLAVPVSFPPTAFEEVLTTTETSPLSAFLHMDYRTYLADDILCKVDRAGMAVSLEAREPLLDHRIIEFVAPLPASFKWHNRKGKRLLRHIVHQYLPKELMERKKMGFAVPVEQWLRKERLDLIDALTDKKNKTLHALVNIEELKKMIHAFKAVNTIDVHRLWKVIMLDLWLKKWI